MTISQPRVVVFDIGGVLCTQGLDFGQAAELLNADPAGVESAYWSLRDRYDLGQRSEDYWTAIATALEVEPPVSELLAQLVLLDCERWESLSTAASRLLDQLAEAGYQLGLLSNAPQPLAETVRSASWSGIFELSLFSSELGLLKPDPRIYQTLLERWRLPAEQIAFFDDRAENVLGAAEAGIQAWLFEGLENVSACLLPNGLSK